MIEEKDFWVLPLMGRSVTQCRVDYAFGMELWESDEDKYSIRISGKFRLIQGTEISEINPEGNPIQTGLALSVLHHKIMSARAFKNGDLELVFESGNMIYVPSSDEYEAWEISGPEGFLFLGLPGGDLAVWKPKEGKNFVT